MLEICFITCTLYIILCDKISYILLLLMGEHHGAIRPSMQIKTNKLSVLRALLHRIFENGFVHVADGGFYAMVMNRRPGLRQAHDEVLQKYDGLIIPTIPCVARKQP